MRVSCSSITSQHEYAWQPGILQLSSDHLLNFFITTSAASLPCCILAVAFLHTVACCLCLPGAVTFSLLVLAHGKFTQSRWYEVKPSDELVTCSSLPHMFGKVYVYVCHCMYASRHTLCEQISTTEIKLLQVFMTFTYHYN